IPLQDALLNWTAYGASPFFPLFHFTILTTPVMVLSEVCYTASDPLFGWAGRASIFSLCFPDFLLEGFFWTLARPETISGPSTFAASTEFSRSIIFGLPTTLPRRSVLAILLAVSFPMI